MRRNEENIEHACIQLADRAESHAGLGVNSIGSRGKGGGSVLSRAKPRGSQQRAQEMSEQGGCLLARDVLLWEASWTRRGLGGRAAQ